MSDLQTSDITGSTPLAILCSDLHLRHDKPSARAEGDWYEVQRKQLEALRNIQKANLDVPIICAGDIFNKWNPPAELISFCLDHMPTMYCIPGQHDLPYHDYDQRYKGAYGALVRAGKIVDLPAEEWSLVGQDSHCRRSFWVWANPWGKYTLPQYNAPGSGDRVKLQVLHAYRWSAPDTKHPKATEESRIGARSPFIDARIIGDNHIPWRNSHTMNHGGFIAQNADQKDFYPGAGILRYATTITHAFYHEFGGDEPKERQWLDAGIELPKEKIAGEVIEQLNQLQGSGDSFADRLKQVIQTTVKQEVKKELENILQKVME